MHKTPFAGLTAPDEGDPPLMVDGGTFATRNPDIIDHFLRIGAVTHVHDAHDPLPDPLVAGSAAVASGGTIPAGRDLYIGYTLLDKYGGETRISPVVSVSTPPPLADPSTAITAAYETSVGDMVVGTYYYGITLVDHTGGETSMGPTVFIERPPGDPLGQINLSGLAAELGPDGADHWRLWRADNGGAFHIIATGTTDTFTDDGINPTDLAAEPPATSQATGATNQITVTLPDAAAEPGLDPAGLGSGFVLYVSDDGAFGSPSLYATIPVASAAIPIVITSLDLTTGSPPDVSTAIPGAHKITAAEVDGVLGGGGGGLLEVLPPSTGRQNYPLRGARILTYGIEWNEGMVLYGRYNESTNGTVLRETYPPSASYAAADWNGDTGAFGLDASGNMDTTGTSGVDHLVYVPSGLAINDPSVELDYEIVGNGWDRLIAGAVSNDATTGYAVIIDRAAVTLSLVYVSDLSPFTFVELGSIGAADGYTAPAIGDSSWVTIRQIGNRLFASDERHPSLWLVADLPAVGVANPTRMMVGGRWTTPSDVHFPYLSLIDIPWALELALAQPQLVDRPPDGPQWEIVDGNAVTLWSSDEYLRAPGDSGVAPWENSWGPVTGESVFYRRGRGHIDIVGAAVGGAADTVLFTMPFAPFQPFTVPTVTDSGPGSATIGADGSVTSHNGGTVHFNISIPLA